VGRLARPDLVVQAAPALHQCRHWLAPAGGPVAAGSVEEGDGVQRLAEG
jgi:hypothetical protein